MVKKFFKNNIIVIVSLFLFAGIVVGIFATGALSNPKGNYDIIIVDQGVSSLNYQIGRASVNRILGSSMETMIGTRINDPHNNRMINEDFWKDDKGNLNPVFTNLYGSDPENDPYHIGGFNEAVEIRNLDSTVDLDGSFDRTISTNWQGERLPGKRFAGSNEIWMNDTKDEIRFYLRGSKNTSSDKHGRWSTGREVTVEDYVFGLFQALLPSNAAYTSYILSDFSTIKGFNEFWNWQLDEDDTPSYEEVENAWDNIYAINVDDKGWNSIDEDRTGIVYSPSLGFIQYRTAPISIELFLSFFNWGSLWPIDKVFFEENVGQLPFYGIDENSISTNGLLRVKDFDLSYGLSLEKNPHYYADVALINNMLYRFVDEPATQGTLFRNGYASQLETTDSTIAEMIKEPEIAPYVTPSFSQAETKFLLFNLAENNERENARFYKNPNFRRAIKFAVDRTNGLDFSGFDTTLPAALASPSRMSTFSSKDGIKNDFTYYANQMETLLRIDGSNIDSQNLSVLDHYPLSIREESLSYSSEQLNDPNNSNEPWYRGEDPKTNKQLASFYYDEFLDDMNEIGISVPSVIELEFLNKDPITEKFYQGFSESLQNNLPQVKLNKRQSTSSNFYSLFEQGEFDMVIVAWFPDFQDSWSSTGIFNRTEPTTRSVNMSGSWTYWTGAQHVYGNTYGDSDISSWGDVGLIDMLEADFQNLIGFNESKPIFSTELGDNVPTFLDIKNLFYLEGTPPPPGVINPIQIGYDPDAEDWRNVKGIVNEDYIVMSEAQRLKLLLIAESMYEYFVPAITVSSEYRRINPSRLVNYAWPSSFGQPNYGLGYDCTRRLEATPTCEDLIS